MVAPAFESLIDRHQREIAGYVMRNLGEADLAQDAFQETFLRAFRAYHRLPATANHRAWLYKIAANVCHDAHRQRARRPLQLDEAVASSEDPDGDTHDLALAVTSFVHTLPQRQRDALLLRKFQGMDYAEIATLLGCSADAARANVYQGLRKVRAHFAEVRND